MIIKDSLSVMSARSNFIFKFFLTMLISFILVLVILTSAVNPKLKDMYKEIDEVNITEHIGKYVSQSIGSDEKGQEIIRNDVAKFKKLLSKYRTPLKESFAIIVVMFLIIFFILQVLFYVLYAMYNAFMSSGTKYRFTSVFMDYFKAANKYALVRMLIVIPYLVLEWYLIIQMSIFAFNKSVLASCVTGVIIFLIMDSLRRVFFSQWSPIMLIEKEGVFKSLWLSIKFGATHLFNNMLFYISVLLLCMAFVGALTVFTFGVGTIFAFAILIMLMHIIPLVINYREKHKEYYIQEGKITSYYQEFTEI